MPSKPAIYFILDASSDMQTCTLGLEKKCMSITTTLPGEANLIYLPFLNLVNQFQVIFRK